jgi:hypothetical protein
MKFPKTRGGTGLMDEPWTFSYPEYGSGGAYQLVPKEYG